MEVSNHMLRILVCVWVVSDAYWWNSVHQIFCTDNWQIGYNTLCKVVSITEALILNVGKKWNKHTHILTFLSCHHNVKIIIKIYSWIAGRGISVKTGQFNWLKHFLFFYCFQDFYYYFLIFFHANIRSSEKWAVSLAQASPEELES